MTPILTRFVTATMVGLSACAGARCDTARAAEPFGTWQTEDSRARIRTERCGSDATRLCGFVVWGKEPLDETGRPKVDRYNPSPAKQGRPQLGMQLLAGLKPNTDGRFEGKIYNADNGKSYDVTVWSDQPTALNVKGCMLAVFCGSQAWSRVMDVAPGQLQGPTDGLGGPHSDPEWAAKPSSGNTASHKGQSSIQTRCGGGTDLTHAAAD